MKWFGFLCLCFLMLGCIAKRIPYEVNATLSTNTANQIIEQTITEQPTNIVPESTIIAPDYIEMNYGTQRNISTRNNGFIIWDGFIIGSSQNVETTKELKKRVYYNSILECKIYIRGKWYIVQVVDTEHRIMHNFYCRNEMKAQKFADALLSLKENVQNHKNSDPEMGNGESKPETKVETAPAQ